MKKQRKGGGLAQAKNYLRPFYNNRKRQSFRQELQAVRQEARVEDLPAILAFAEANPAFPFPGFGNTFPNAKSRTPNIAFGPLKPLGLARELDFQIARLNFHSEKLVAALQSISRINSLLTAEQYAAAEQAIANHQSQFGLSLTIAKKELLLSVYRSSLPGLVKKYKALTDEKGAGAWGVLCHFAYDLVDPTFDPVRAAQNAIGVVRNIPNNKRWCVDILETEILASSYDDKAIALAVMRYSALSLVDLAFVIWRLAHTSSGAITITAALGRLDTSIKSLLISDFSTLQVRINAYRLTREKAPDSELYRTSYFFDDVADVSVWRADITRGALKDFAAAGWSDIVLPSRLDAAAESVAGDPSSAAVVIRDLLSWECSIQNKDEGVANQNLLAAIVAAESVRKIDIDSEIDPQALTNLLANTQDIHQFVSLEKLEKLAETRPAKSSGLLQFVIRELIYRKSRTLDNELERRLAFMNLFVGRSRQDIVLDCRAIFASNPATARILAQTCTRTFLERLFLLMTSVKDVLETRLEICSWLLEINSDDVDAVKEEKEALQRELENLDARVDLDSTRVHVDEEALREWFRETQLPSVSRYIQTLLAEGAGAEFVSLVDFYASAQNKAAAGEEADFTDETQIGSAFLLVPIVDATLAAFKSDRTFGLDSYLSRRIRHGTLLGQVMTPVNRVLKRWAEMNDLSGLAQGTGPSSNISKVIAEWSKYLNAALDEIRREIIQINSDEHPAGLIQGRWRTAGNIQYLDAMIARVRQRIFEAKGAYDPFPDLYAFCWDCLETDLAHLRLFMARSFLPAAVSNLTQLFNGLEREDKRISLPFIIDLSETLQARILDVCGWFIRPVVRRDKYDLRMLVGSTLSIVKELDTSYAFSEEVHIVEEITLNRGGFDVIGDALFVLVGNAARHGKPDGLIRVSAHKIEESVVEIEINSEVSSVKAHETAMERITSIFDRLDKPILERAAVEEGFSGLRKLIVMLSGIRSSHVALQLINQVETLRIGFRLRIPVEIIVRRLRG